MHRAARRPGDYTGSTFCSIRNTPATPAYADHSGAQVMHFRSGARAIPDAQRDRYLFLGELGTRKR